MFNNDVVMILRCPDNLLPLSVSDVTLGCVRGISAMIPAPAS